MEFNCSGSRYWKIPVFIGVPVLVLLIVILGISFCLCVYFRRKRRMNASKAANTAYEINYTEKTPGQNLGGYHHREIVEKGIEMEPNVVYAKAKDLIMEPSVVYGLVAED